MTPTLISYNSRYAKLACTYACTCTCTCTCNCALLALYSTCTCVLSLVILYNSTCTCTDCPSLPRISLRCVCKRWLVFINYVLIKNLKGKNFEAFVGAIYLDHSYEVAEKFIISVIETYVDFTDILLTDTNFKDQILRYFQHNYKTYPTYKHIPDETNDKLFICELLKDNEIISIGKGISKKKAEQDASYNALIKFNVLT